MVTLLRSGRVVIAVLLLSGVAWALSSREVARAGSASPVALASSRAAAESPRGEVEAIRMPEDGRMPRAVVDAEGTVHLVYVQGGTNRANLFHATREPGEPGWSESQQVNSQELSVSGVGPIDGAQLALGSDNRLHVVWLQSEPPRFFYT